MKKYPALILALIFLCCALPGWAQSEIVIDDSSGWTIGRIRENGDVVDATGWTIGHIRENGDVVDATGWTIGRIRENLDVVDATGWTIGRIRENGDVVDATGWTIGYIRSGSIDYSSGFTALRFSGPTDHTRLAAYIFFFNRVLGK